MNIAESLERAAELTPKQPAIVFEGRVVSYAELALRAAQVAHFLEGAGVASGDRIALFLPNIPEFAIAYYGAQKLGAVVVSLNSMLKAAELKYALLDSQVKLVFTTELLVHELDSIRTKLPALDRIVVCEGAAAPASSITLEQALAGCSTSFSARARSERDPAAILYTSGTTGKSKGAVLTHGNLASNAAATVDCVNSQTGDRHLLFLPLSHCFTQNFIMNAAFRACGCIVLERRFQLDIALDDIQRHSVTHFYGVPTIFIYFLEANVARAQFDSVRFFFSAAAMMPREVAATWRERFGAPIFEGYGLTETSPLATYNHLDSYRFGSVGTPIEGVTVAILDENGCVCADREWGEICIRGPNVMLGYHGRDQETAEALRGGWFHSGDIGYRDADGYYYVVDRLKDMINCAGYKVWPREVEEVLYRHAAIAECAVVGKSDPIKGERVSAYVRLKPQHHADATILRRHCEAELARYKLPEEFVFDREIPKNPSGKVLKRVLRG